MFDFGIDESWRAVRRALENVTGGTCDITVMRKMWEENKKQLFPLFDGTGRIVSSVDDTLVTEDMQREVAHQATMGSIDKVHGKGLLSFAQREHLIIIARRVLSHVLPIEIAENKIHYNREDPRNPDKVLNGVKFGTYVRYLAQKEFDSDLLVDTIVTAFSCATAAIKRKAYQVVISINPLDMLFASEHTTGWSSCHALDESRTAGALAYTLDSASAVAYAYTYTKTEGLTGQTLPIKVWRQMVFFDLDTHAAVTSRQYPEDGIWYSETVERVLGEMVCKLGGGGVPKTILYRGEGRTGQCGYSRQGPWHYYDDLQSVVKLEGVSTRPLVSPGVVELPCVKCGRKRTDSVADNLFCYLCGDYGAPCADCGNICMRDSDETSWYNHDAYCRNCWENNFSTCGRCGEPVPDDDVFEGDGEHLCERCFDRNYEVCEVCNGATHRDNVVVDSEGTSYCRDCAEELLYMCDECGEHYRERDIVQLRTGTFCCDCAAEDEEAC